MARGLFPFPLAAYQIAGAPKQEPPKQGGTQQVGSRRGFMGAFQRKSLPRTLQVIGATLQQMDNPQGQLDQFAANEMRQRAVDMAQQAQDRTAQQEKTQQGAMEEAIASLPPEQQAWARLNPEAFARAYLESQIGGAWETNGTTPYRVGPNGEVIMGSGTIPHRPRAPLIQYGIPGDAADWEYGE